MNKDEFSDALAGFVGEEQDSDLVPGEQAPGPQRLKAPLNNFFGDDFLTLLYFSTEPCPRGLAHVKTWLSLVADRKTPRHERAAAALDLGRFLLVRQTETIIRRVPGSSHPIDWFTLARELNSVVGALALANALLAQRDLTVRFDLSADPMPQLVSLAALPERSDPSVDEEVARAWCLGARVALRHVQRRFSGWDKESFRCALASIVNYLTILPRESMAFASLPDRRVALTWIKPLWDRLIQAAPECESDPHTYRAALIEQQLAVLLVLDDMQESGSVPASTPFGRTPAVDRAPTPESASTPPAGADRVVVIRGAIAGSSEKGERDILKIYEVLRGPLPLTPLPGMAGLLRIRETLADEFPWASEAVSVVMRDLLARRRHGVVRLGMSPVLLVGLPGTGKTRFAQRLSDLLGTPNTVINMAGMSDVKVLKGVTRGWSSNRPSRMLEFIQQTKVANPLFVLDEIDKAGEGYSNGGDPQEALLDLLEPGNARRYQDIYLLAECDLSHCLYVATSNSVARIPEPLLSRLRPVYFPPPGPEHAEVIVQGMLADLACSWGLPEGALTVAPHQIARLRGLAPRELRRALLDILGREESGAAYTLH
jgi:hypothetical protein